MKKVLCSPLPFGCTLARKLGLVETKQNRGVFPAYHIERSVFQLSRTKDIERSGTLYKKARMEQNRSIDPSLKQPRRFEGLVPFIAVFPYSELTPDAAKSVAWAMTVRFSSRFPFGHRTHKHTNTWKKFCVRFRWMTLNSSVRKSLIEFDGKLYLILFNFIRCLILISRVPSQIDLSWFIEKEIKRKFNKSPEISQPSGCTLARK